jgi:hypothetical protein
VLISVSHAQKSAEHATSRFTVRHASTTKTPLSAIAFGIPSRPENGV